MNPENTFNIISTWSNHSTVTSSQVSFGFHMTMVTAILNDLQQVGNNWNGILKLLIQSIFTLKLIGIMDVVTYPDLNQVPYDGSLGKDHYRCYVHAVSEPRRNNFYPNHSMDIDFMTPKCDPQEQSSRQLYFFKVVLSEFK